jgi:H+/Cl- antiporter ClcA
VVVVITTMLGVFACKCAGLAGPAILLGAVIGMVCGLLFDRASRRVVHRGAPDAGGEAR